jgi:hypothetical protein
MNSQTNMAVGTISQQIIFTKSWKYVLQMHRFDGFNSSLVLFTQYWCHLPFVWFTFLTFHIGLEFLHVYLSVFWTLPVKWFNSKTISVRECNKKHWILELKIQHWHRRANSVTQYTIKMQENIIYNMYVPDKFLCISFLDYKTV